MEAAAKFFFHVLENGLKWIRLRWLERRRWHRSTCGLKQIFLQYCYHRAVALSERALFREQR
jgi:hypothetical protein